MKSEFHGEAEDFFVEGNGPVDVKEDHFKTPDSKQSKAEEKPKAAGGLAGMIVGDSAIATVGLVGAGLNYRGYDINELSENSTFEEIYYLLIYERLPTK